MPDTKDVQLPGKVGLKAIGGVMKHLGALTAIGSSTVNSYRRLWDTGFWAPVYADWGYQNRTCGLRVSAPGRFEEINKGDVVYIDGNAKHALKNNGKETLKFYWIFPTDRFSEVEYFY